jgi:hypothetical protein
VVISDPWFWSTVLFAVLFAGLAIGHFRNPFPLITIPELPHHIYFTDEPIRHVLLDILTDAGHPAYGRFIAGADQILLHNGTTVLGLKGPNDPPAALVIPVKGRLDRDRVIDKAVAAFTAANIRTTVISVPNTCDLLLRLSLENTLGFDLVFRPPGKTMMMKLGFPKFVKL